MLLPDISEWQPNADLAGIQKANGGAVILRAAYGADHPDKVFARYRAQAAGFAFCGLYHYLVASQDVTAQAKAFCQIAGKLAPHEVPILDLEEGGGNQEARANEWCSVVDGTLGLASRPLNERSWLYSGSSFAVTSGLTPVFDSARHTWVAAYGPDEPSLGHTLWQCTNGAVGSNITDWPGAGRCDTSLYHGTLAQLAALSGRYQPSAPAAPPAGPWITAGDDSLSALAASRKSAPATVLQLTAQHGGYTAATAAWLDDVFAGTAHAQEPMPKGVTLYLPF